ncbi:MAG: chemotaxis protein CheB [Prosthecobacter sp.]
MPDDPTRTSAQPASLEDPAAGTYECPFPIVALGASAGGMTALRELLQVLPEDTGMGFVVVSHLPPDRESSLADILARAASIPVREAEHEQEVKPNHVYVMPPGHDMTLEGGKLRLLEQESGTRHRRIDLFFRSMAEDCGHKGIGVVLSGSGSDGSLGIESIKAEGGITFAQDETAEHGHMPRNAIATGCVDFVLAPAAIASEIARIARHPYVLAGEGRAGLPWPGHARITEIVRRSSGVDFTHYKSNTMYRRITRRMVLHKLESAEDYEEMLRRSPEEVESLYQDLLINVTSFFRNPDAFDTLAAKILPALLAGRPGHEPVRIWTLGCSTGEEAYSLAMTFAECAEAAESPAQLQLFATDLSAGAIEKARAGLYPHSIEQDVSPERLRRFFVAEEGGYRICKAIREQCIFSRHNALTDPPFSRLDLISCRNLLIYLEPMLQQQIMARVHYALKPGAYLWLGSSESVGASRALFDVEIGRHKIFTRRPGPTPPGPRFRQATAIPTTGVFSPAPPTQPQPPHAELHREAERLLLTKYAPPGVVISPDMEIVQFRGDTGAYLTPASGTPSLNLLKMLREGLLLGVRSLVRRAGEEGRPVRDEGLKVKSNGEFHDVAVEVIPLKGAGKDGGFVVLFDSGQGAPRTEALSTPGDPDDEIRRLTQELETTRDYLQSVIEHQEAVNEELQSANEEAQSANEEMQSINEELETSKEEIQSTNEELATVNDELTNRNLELARLSNDLNNVLVSVRIPIVIFGPDLRIRRFTPSAEKALDLAEGDVGRSLSSVKLSLAIPNLEPLLREVIDSGAPREKDVQDMQGRWCSLRARPYQTPEHVIDGVVMTLVDIDALMRARDYAESILAGVPMPMVVLDSALRVKRASVSFYETFRVAAEATEGRFIHDLGNRQWDIPKLRVQLEEVLPRERELQDFEVSHTFERIGHRIMMLNARRLVQPAGNEPLIVLSIRDITEHRALEESLIERAAELAQADRAKDEFLAMLAHELRNPLAPLRNAAEILQADDATADERGQVLEMLGRQIGNMSRMIDDLLDVSRITEGKIELRKQPVALTEILTSAVNAARSSLTGRSQQLTLLLPEEPVVLDADATRLEQVFGNLIGNASKYSGDGTRITLKAERSMSSEPPEVIISVRDEGIGIPPEILPRVFDLFMQATRALDRTHGGLGIGLTLVQRLVRQHGGSVEAHSEGAGHGSEFIVRLPLQPGHTLVPQAVVTPQREPSRRLLIVDDNQDSARSMATLQRRRGHETRIACTGLEALTVAAEFLPDVVLLDIGLPRMDGFEVARQLRAMPALSGVLLLAMSGYGCSTDLEKAKQAGFDEYFIKPVDLDRLRECMRKHPLVQHGGMR